MSNTWGSHLHLSIFGESHGNGIGMVLDGIEPGTRLDLEKLAAQMKRRAPGGALATARKARHDHELVARNGDIYVLEVVVTRALDDDAAVFHRSPVLPLAIIRE